MRLVVIARDDGDATADTVPLDPHLCATAAVKIEPSIEFTGATRTTEWTGAFRNCPCSRHSNYAHVGVVGGHDELRGGSERCLGLSVDEHSLDRLKLLDKPLVQFDNFILVYGNRRFRSFFCHE